MEILIVVGVIVLLVVIVGIYLWSTYNGLVTLNVRVDEAWSDITVQLKRRADLILLGLAKRKSGKTAATDDESTTDDDADEDDASPI